LVREELSHRVNTLLTMEILEPHGKRFEVALEFLREGRSFTFDGVRFSLSSEEVLVVTIQASYWQGGKTGEETAVRDLRRAKSVADYLARENSMFNAIYWNHRQLFILVNYYGHGGEMEIARLVDGKFVWVNRL